MYQRIVSYIILGIMIIVFFTSLNRYSTGKDLIDYLIRDFQHANTQHILFNGISFFSLSFIETIMGSKQYLFCLFFLWIVSSYLLLIYHTVWSSRKVLTVGFSGIIFGMMVVYLSLLGKSKSITLIGLLVSVIPQFFMPGISYEGHICGIIAGFLYVILFPIDKYNSKMVEYQQKSSQLI